MKKLFILLAMTSMTMSSYAQKRIKGSPFERDSISFSCRTNKSETTISLSSSAKSLMKRVMRKYDYAAYQYEGLLCKVVENKKYIIDDSVVESHWTWFGRYTTKRVVQCYMSNSNTMDCLERDDAEQERCNCKYPFHPLSSPLVWIGCLIIVFLAYIVMKRNKK